MRTLIITVLCLVQSIIATDYCDKSLCTYGNVVYRHIACNDPLAGQFDRRKCVKPVAGNLGPNANKTILKTMNDLRNKLASGAIGFDTASKLPELVWDSELATLATLNTKQCEMKHDDCHTTNKFKWAGQNLAIQYQSNKITEESVIEILCKLIKSWFDEYKDTSKTDLESYPRQRDPTLPQIGHFTAMAQDKGKYVGCGYSTYMTSMSGRNWYTILFACNFSYTNVVGTPAYAKGKPCSQCKTKCSEAYPSLCSASEVVDSNP